MGHEYLAYREYTPENFAKLLVEKVQKAGDKGTVHIAGGVFDISCGLYVWFALDRRYLCHQHQWIL